MVFSIQEKSFGIEQSGPYLSGLQTARFGRPTVFETFSNPKQLLRQEPVQAEDRNQLKELLKVVWWWYLPLLQNFNLMKPMFMNCSLTEKTLWYIADEGQRTQKF